jgi:glutaredoxin
MAGGTETELGSQSMNKWLFLSIVFAGFLNWYSDGWIFSSLNSVGASSYNDEIMAITPLHDEDVILYATQWCGYCKKTRAFLDNKGIAYIEYDIEHSAIGRQQYASLNGNGVPLMIVKSEIIRGYSTKAIMNALAK